MAKKTTKGGPPKSQRKAIPRKVTRGSGGKFRRK